MNTRADIAADFFKQGYNCAQAVTMAFSDMIPLTSNELMNVSSAFGGGFARTRSLCGAVSAMGMVVGLAEDHTQEPRKDKEHIYRVVRELTEKFEERNHTLNCGELLKDIKNLTSDYKPDERDEEYYKKRPCLKFVRDAAEILEQYFEKQNSM